jgi:hypothetical protein
MVRSSQRTAVRQIAAGHVEIGTGHLAHLVVAAAIRAEHQVADADILADGPGKTAPQPQGDLGLARVQGLHFRHEPLAETAEVLGQLPGHIPDNIPESGAYISSRRTFGKVRAFFPQHNPIVIGHALPPDLVVPAVPVGTDSHFPFLRVLRVSA